MSEKVPGAGGDSSCICCVGDNGVPAHHRAAPPCCPAPLRPAGLPVQTDTDVLAHPLSPELSFSISFLVGLSDVGGFLNAVLVLYFQHYWRVITTCDLPL